MEEEENIQPIENREVPEEIANMITTDDGTSVDPFDSPTPGESLTMSPDSKFPWERPSQYSEVRPFMEDLFLKITEEENYIELLGLFLDSTPIDELTQMILYTSMANGKINPDLLLLSIEPLMYLLIAIAEQNDIEPVIYAEEDEDLDDEQKNVYMEESEKKLKDIKPEKIRKSSVEPSLLAKVEELPTAEELGIGTEQEKEIE
jgi:hypothetical protein|tara:strand:- start:6264 stop:6875 length:612 start_codon:yes stop_codon:yes gene_type:complete